MATFTRSMVLSPWSVVANTVPGTTPDVSIGTLTGARGSLQLQGLWTEDHGPRTSHNHRGRGVHLSPRSHTNSVARTVPRADRPVRGARACVGLPRPRRGARAGRSADGRTETWR